MNFLIRYQFQLIRFVSDLEEMKIVLFTIVAIAFGSILPPSGYGSMGWQRSIRERKLSPYQLQRGKFKMQFNRSRNGRMNVRGMRHGFPLME